MNCPFCRAIIPDNVPFCPHCGSSLIGNKQSEAVGNESQRYHNQRNSIRENETAILNNLIAHFSQKQHAYDEYDRVSEKLRYYERGSSNALIIWGAIIFTFGLLFILFSLVPLTAYGFMIFTVFPGFFMLLGGILLKINNAVKCNRYEKKYQRLSLELSNYYMTYPNCPVPAEYTNPRILYMLLTTIQFGRADCIRDSLNCVLSSIDQRRFAAYMSEMQRYTARINYESGISLIFAASYLFS